MVIEKGNIKHIESGNKNSEGIVKKVEKNNNEEEKLTK